MKYSLCFTLTRANVFHASTSRRARKNNSNTTRNHVCEFEIGNRVSSRLNLGVLQPHVLNRVGRVWMGQEIRNHCSCGLLQEYPQEWPVFNDAKGEDVAADLTQSYLVCKEKLNKLLGGCYWPPISVAECVRRCYRKTLHRATAHETVVNSRL